MSTSTHTCQAYIGGFSEKSYKSDESESVTNVAWSSLAAG